MPLRQIEDGLTADEIEGRISHIREVVTTERQEELAERDRALDAKLEKHKEEIAAIAKVTTGKVDALADTVGTMQTNISVLVGTDQLEGLIPKMVANQERVLEGMAEAKIQAQSWHEGELQFRKEVQNEVRAVDAKVEANEQLSASRHGEVVTKLNHLKWLIWLFQTMSRTGELVLTLGRTGKEIWPILAFMTAAWVAIMQWIHVEMPRTSAWTQKHSSATLGLGVFFIGLALLSAFRKSKTK